MKNYILAASAALFAVSAFADCGDEDAGGNWAIYSNSKITVCAESHSEGCGWHETGVYAIIKNNGQEIDCYALYDEENYSHIDASKMYDASKVTNKKALKVLKKSEPNFIVRDEKGGQVCFNYADDDTWQPGGEVCFSFKEAASFLTPYGMDLLNIKPPSSTVETYRDSKKPRIVMYKFFDDAYRRGGFDYFYGG